MIVSADIIPNTPFLIEEIGKENYQKCKKTTLAINKIKKKYEKLEIDTLIIIGKQAKITPEAFTFNIADKYTSNFEKFGVYSHKENFYLDHEIFSKIRHLYSDEYQTDITNEKQLTYTISTPLILLLENLKNTSILPIGYSSFNANTHYLFGKDLGEPLHESKEKIAILTSTNLSYKENALKNNKKIIKIIESNDFDKLMKLDNGEDELPLSSIRCISLLYGIIQNLKPKTKILEYEHPFEIGFLTASLNIKK